MKNTWLSMLIRNRKQERVQNKQNGLIYVDNLTCFKIPWSTFNPEVTLLLNTDHVVSHAHTKNGSCQRTVHCLEKLKEWETVSCVFEHSKQVYEQHGKFIQREPVLASHLCFLVKSPQEKEQFRVLPTPTNRCRSGKLLQQLAMINSQEIFCNPQFARIIPAT